jgi:hypothetical protein
MGNNLLEVTQSKLPTLEMKIGRQEKQYLAELLVIQA